ncbi:CRISPR-associated protein Cas5 [Mucilaginibacter sp.]|uniref:CRISPR-associated protein Cas5 n=1 Tax=Mucilaginibacter sp. TaxID=1882438 RepID=UPI002850F35C|nr:CRISPR-associated protein Cas5 [Mucilaginibacter sp.]MDR3695604.1 CRISPR-associated protein Cas5 [Mucilaginibacter sp.]
MKALQFTVRGNWGHFRKPETNNNPLSHDFITKTALIGLIGAVIGKERKEMKPLFPQLSNDLKYNVKINNAVQKQSWGFTFRGVSDAYKQAPKQMEIIRNPDYLITLGLFNNNSEVIFEDFKLFLQNSLSKYTPILGLHNCPAELEFIEEGDLLQHNGEFETSGFISVKHRAKNFSRLGFEKIPTYQNDDFWNLPEKYVQVVYPSENKTILAEGDHFTFNNQSQWFLI